MKELSPNATLDEEVREILTIAKRYCGPFQLPPPLIQRIEAVLTAPQATLTEQDIKRFRVGDILFNDEQATIFCEFAMQGLRAAAYAEANPLGGPAKVFRTIADRIEAGEEYYSVLADYNLIQTPSAIPSASDAKDAVRYRWLRTPHKVKNREDFYHRTCWVCSNSEAELDEAVDKMMAEDDGK